MRNASTHISLFYSFHASCVPTTSTTPLERSLIRLLCSTICDMSLDNRTYCGVIFPCIRIMSYFFFLTLYDMSLDIKTSVALSSHVLGINPCLIYFIFSLYMPPFLRGLGRSSYSLEIKPHVLLTKPFFFCETRLLKVM